MGETQEKHWAAIWGNAVSINENRPEAYSKNITLRYPVYCPFDGEKMRLTFDNYCGFEAVTLSKVTVLDGAVFYPVFFDGKSSVTIPAGESVVSDELAIDVKARKSYAVSIYLGDYTLMRSTVYIQGPLTGGQYAIGDQTRSLSLPVDLSRKTGFYYFLSNVSVYTSSENRAIVCYGDSITAQDWPDYLMMRCMELGKNHTSIIRRATSGSRILREYNCITYESYGLKGTHRFTHEVPTDGADTVLIQQGINDIIHPVGTDVNPFRPMSDLPTVQELIDGLKWYIEKCREYGYKVYVGTLIPFYDWRTYAPFREKMKAEYNEWIRTTDLIDGFVDFEKALQSSANPYAFAKEYDSGDHLHPSGAGYKAMAAIVPESILK